MYPLMSCFCCWSHMVSCRETDRSTLEKYHMGDACSCLGNFPTSLTKSAGDRDGINIARLRFNSVRLAQIIKSSGLHEAGTVNGLLFLPSFFPSFGGVLFASHPSYTPPDTPLIHRFHGMALNQCWLSAKTAERIILATFIPRRAVVILCIRRADKDNAVPSTKDSNWLSS